MSSMPPKPLSSASTGTHPATPTDRRVIGDTRGLLGRVHQALLVASFYPAAACTALAMGMLMLRSAWTGTAAFLFLIWNLFLAWVPWFFSLPFAFRSPRVGPFLGAPLFVAWLLCLPNAPYLATDLIHLHPREDAPLWFDTTLLFFFAWTGCLLGFLSLEVMHRWVAERWGRLRGWSFVGAAAMLTGFGIYLGRFRRWNSWDLLTQPRSLLTDTLRQLVHPSFFPRTWLVTLLFAAFFVSAYCAIASNRTQDQR